MCCVAPYRVCNLNSHNFKLYFSKKLIIVCDVGCHKRLVLCLVVGVTCFVGSCLTVALTLCRVCPADITYLPPGLCIFTF